MEKSVEQSRSASPSTSGPKRPAGRTKFQETRHPVFRGVRRRHGRWVCEVRVLGSRGARLWVGTFHTADAAARAHDAAMLALRGVPSAAAAGLNFDDSAWLLHVDRRAPAVVVSGAALLDVQRAANEAVTDFLQHRGAAASSTTHASSAPDALTVNAAPSFSGETPAAAQTPPVGAALDTIDSDMLQLGDMFGGMDADAYYASLAQGLLLQPPATTRDCSEDGERGDAEMVLWS